MRKSHSSKLLLCGWILILTSNMCLAQSFSISNNIQTVAISQTALSTTSQLSLVINPFNLALSMEPHILTIGNHPISTETFTINRKWRVVPNNTIGKTSIEIHENILNNLEVPENTIPVIIVSDEVNFMNNNDFIPLNKVNNHLVGTYQFFQQKYITLGFAKTTTIKSHIHFNGKNDFIRVDTPDFSNNNFTISTWIKISNQSTSSQEKTILNFTGLSNEIHFKLDNLNKLTFNVNDSNQSFSFTSNTSIPLGKWHYISVTKENENISMFIDGVLDSTVNTPFEIDNTFDQLFIGARKNDTSMVEFFNGGIDELRIWKIALSTSELRLLMNQEIEKKGRNKIIGTGWNENQTFQPLKDLKWEQLSLYFSMNHYIGNQLLDKSNNQKTGAFSNPDSILIQNQSSPLPYTTTSSGDWFVTGTWENGSEIQLPCSPSIVDASVTIDWNIVTIGHDVFSHGNKTLSGLKINEGTLFAKNNSKIEVSHYLKLMGTIDLVGTSQLIQTLDSYLDPQSSGKIERDQQGTSNRFNYNYWCSPVGNQNNTLVNHGHSVSGVMRDGTDPNNPIPMSWVSGINPPVTSNPITLSSYWIFRFQNMTPTYANWTGVGANGWLQAGHGFTMKGSNQATTSQNYVFVGKPNNGRITSQIGPNNLNLTGNPYPSALDAHQFIKDNINSITGSLYFWEHFETNNTHNLSGYQGGYAMVNLVGGIQPKVPQEISQLGSSNRIPGRFIPVGQGFMVYGNTTGGPIVFDNHQRSFIKEENTLSNPMFRNANFSETAYFTNNQEDVVLEDDFKKIRLDFTLPNGFKRQLLAGYMNQWATPNFDRGYDAPILDNQDDEAFFKVANYSLAILGDSYFEVGKIHPLGIKSTTSGTLTISLNETIHFDENIEIYIYDQLLNQYHNLKEGPLNVAISQGTFENRFSLRYQNPNLLSTGTFNSEENIIAFYSNDDKHIHVKSNDLIEVKKIEVYNTLGQKMIQKQLENHSQKEVAINAVGLSTGTYLVSVSTDRFTSSKKIIIK